MKPVRDVVAAIGRTPMIKLRAASEATGCTILGKAEFMNPGGSVKDRAALAIIKDAVERGALRPGGVVVEGTAGNTGIGLAHVANSRGYRCVIVMPDNQSPEKYQTIEALGADVLRVKTVPYSDPNHYQKIARRLADEIPDAVWA
ncbi:MAG TPA: pyridoxal-phosphate dependent enzyme, partial [Roseiarcus sp.]|nr:pyridoxal-phosphate dependent enzyme [Roseiarcus sp.]